jgi:two-component system chemotaxis sensor kinase CheA
MIEDPQLHQLFKAESTEHLARLDDGLLRLEKNCADQALLEEVFREAHSLKGSARMLGLFKIETSAHGLESILNTARKGETPLTQGVIEQMTVVLGDLRTLVQEALAVPFVEARSAEPLGEAQTTVSTPVTTSPIASSPSPATSQSLKEEGFVTETALPVPHTELSQSKSVPTAGEPFHIETVRVETRKLDDLLTLTGELSVIQGRVQHRLSLMDEMQEQWAALERSRRKFRFMLRRAENREALAKTDETMRQMLHADGEALTQLGSRIRQTRDSFYEDGARLEAAANTLEERVHAIRLLPLSTVFSLFPRMVRDLAREQGKEVELVIEGGDLNVDKRVLEEMKDPLMHLLRNAIDHGIEPPAERERLGKPRSSALQLRAVQENNTVLLEVRDDGRGLDIDAIRHVALQHGLHDEATLAAMTTAQLQQLIFLPGFTTSTYITELSGRGVGLDVVRINVERLKGNIHMESAPHHGTAMQLRLPLSLSTTRLLLVGVDGHRYGLPIEFVHISRRVREEDIFTLEGRPAFELYGQAVIAPRLADLLALPSGNQNSETVCVVIQVGDELLGLRVDELLDEEEVLAKPLGVPLQRVRNVSGLSILGSGEICAVLNPADLLRSAHKLAATSAHSKLGLAEPPVKSCILLVEDTMLVRVMEKRILEDAGYEVVTAVDGVDALNELGLRPFAAVVSDIMMPNMDGLTLTSRIRREPLYRDLPVILVTSLASDEDKQRGLEVGANAYIPKPAFDQRVLLDTLQRLIVP